MSRRLFIGIGNQYRRDDGVGLEVARMLHEKSSSAFEVIKHSGEGTGLMDLWEHASDVIICDAVSSGVAPGTIHRLEAHHEILPSGFFRYSTHAFNFAEAVELARSLNKLPERMIVYGVEGKNFSAGEGLSDEVERAAQSVVKSVMAENCHA